VENGILVFMDLAEQGAYLHMSFALVLKQFKFERRLLRVVKVFLEVLTIQLL
jgi:hypothetical protein